MLKIKSRISVVLIFIVWIGMILIPTKTNAAERIYWYGKMTSGKDIYYWVDGSNSYGTRINEAKNKLRYPTGMWNPMVLNATKTKSWSKMDLYQYYDSSSSTYAYTERYKPKTNGNENILYLSELDTTDWQYSKIYINHSKISTQSTSVQSTIILHEMCHCYGGKDVYDNPNTIMYGYTPVVTGMTSDFNAILVSKYNY